MNTKLKKLAKTHSDTVMGLRRARLVKRLFETAVRLMFALTLTVIPALATQGGAAARFRAYRTLAEAPVRHSVP